MKEEFRQYLVLTRHFFDRLFQNDVVDFADQMKERVIGVLTILAGFCGFLAYIALYKYAWIEDLGTSWREKALMITLYMLVMGLVAILEWDIIFPDSRDFANLSPLPLHPRTLFAAKFSSLFLFVGIFALGMNAISTLSFLVYLPQWQPSPLVFAGRLLLAHLFTMFLACFFMFFFNVALSGLLLTVLGYRLFTRLSTYIRSFFLLIYVSLFLLYFRLLLYGTNDFVLLDRLRSNHALIRGFFDLFPPFWFTDLYETLLGNPTLPFHGSYTFAMVSMAAAVGVFYISFGLNYKRYLKHLESSRNRKDHLIGWKRSFSALFSSIFLKNPVQRSVFHFYGKTFRSSMFHRMRLASFLTVAVAVFLVRMLPQARNLENLFGINKAMLALPLILSFFLILGLRGGVNMPVNLEANWVFQLTEVKKRRHYFAGMRKGIFFLNLLPLFTLLFLFYAFLWGWQLAFYHCLFGLTVATLIMEVFFLHYCKLPFACTYLPGKEKLQLFWIIYLLAFLVYINFFVWLDHYLLRNPQLFGHFFGVSISLILGVRFYQWIFYYQRITIKYDEEPEPAMVGLDYQVPMHKRRAHEI
jgi:hypothetical protein